MNRFLPGCLFVLLLATNFFRLAAQNVTIDFENPPVLTVCDSAIFKVTLTNSGSSTLNDIAVNIKLPGMITYLPGSMIGASEQDISNRESPVFQVANLAGGSSRELTFYLFASCDVLDALNRGQLFTNEIIVTTPGGTTTITTDPYAVETPFLVITNVTNRLLKGSRGDRLRRTFTIRNTRLGALRSFRFSDMHRGGIQISSFNGSDINPDYYTFELELDGDDFRLIGDGDALFEYNESIIIFEDIDITACGVDTIFSLSNINVSWGCRGAVCQSNSTNMFLDIGPNRLAPDLEFEAMPASPEDCFCGADNGVIQRLKITNAGNDVAQDIAITIKQDTNFLSNQTALAPSFQLDSAGQVRTLDDVSLVGPKLFDTGCGFDQTLYGSAVVRLPQLQPGESVILIWQTFTCQFICIQNGETLYAVEAAYRTICPPPDNRLISERLVVEERNPAIEALLTELNQRNNNGIVRTDLRYLLRSNFLNNNNGQVQIRIQFPDFFGMITNSFLLGGRAPVSTQSQTMNGRTTFELQFDLDFPLDSAALLFTLENDCAYMEAQNILPDCLISTYSTCAAPCFPVIDGPPSFPIRVEAIFDTNDTCPDICRPSACTSIQISSECPIDSICIDTIPGFVDFDFSIFRKNIGLADSDDNRIADSNAPADVSQIRLDRYMPGDTVSTVYRGVVQVDITGEEFHSANATLSISGSTPLDVVNRNMAFFSSGGITNVFRYFKIYDKSKGSYYACPAVPLVAGRLPNTLNFKFDLSPAALRAAGNSVPGDFLYSEGDSLLLYAEYRIVRNLFSNTQIPPKVTFGAITTLNVFNDEAEIFFCQCYKPVFEITGYEYKLSPGLFPVAPCEVSEFTGGSLLEFELAEGNFFPFEVRPLGIWKNFEIGFSDEIDLVEARMSSLALQGTSNIQEDVPLAAQRRDSIYIFNLENIQRNPLLDEGFYMLLQYRFDGKCNFKGAFPTRFAALLDFLNDFPNEGDITSIEENSNALRALIPNLNISTPLPSVESNDRFGRWPLRLQNIPTSVGSPTSGPALNTWLYPESLTGDVTDFQLFDVNANTFLPQVNGIFQIGSYPENADQQFILIGNNQSCKPEKVQVRYGWDCMPYEDPAESPCYQRSIELSVFSLPGEIETILDTTAVRGDLCDTLPYFTIEIFNAELGTLYEPQLEVTLSPGLRVVPGSSQIAHAAGSAFVTVDDPENLPGNIVRWKIENLIDSIAIRGLPGVTRIPQNSLELRFRTIADCGFIAESYPIFKARGVKNCEQGSNTRVRAASPIQINGAPPPYRTSISAQATGTLGCEEEVNFSFRLTPDNLTGDRDSIFLTLPSGLTYVPGSYQPGGGAPPNAPLIFNNGIQQILKWKIPQNHPAGQTMTVELALSGFDMLSCQQEFLLLQTVTAAEARCVATNELCDILVQTGSLFLPLDIERPAFVMTDLKLEIQVGANTEIANYQVTISNNGNVDAGNTVVDFYWDRDGDGQISPGDERISSGLFSFLGAGGSTILNGTLDIGGADICSIMAVIDPDKNCACDTDVVTVTLPVTRTFETPFITCSDIPVNIGLDDSQATTMYRWEPDDHLSCPDCPQPVFQFKNTGPIEKLFQYELLEENQNGCTIENGFTVIVQPEPRILNADQSICENDCVILQTTPASNVTWAGPGIIHPNEPEQQVYPTMDAIYIASIADSEGCMGTDSIAINVLPAPVADAGPDTVKCIDQALELNVVRGAGLTYSWSPAAAVSNPAIPNPVVTSNEPVQLQLTVTDTEGCTATDIVFINVISENEIVVSANTVICAGSAAILSVQGATEYRWFPVQSLDCADCEQVEATPDTTTTYTVIGSLGGACPDTATVMVTVVPDTIFTFDTLALCQGETVEIFGNEVSEAGDYSAMFISSTDCDSVHTITLELLMLPDFDVVATDPVCPDSCTGRAHIISMEDNIQVSINGGPFIRDTIFENLCPGNYNFRIQDENNCTAQIADIQLVEAPSGGIEISGDTLINAGDSIQLFLEIPDGVIVAEIIWEPEEGLSCVDCPNPIASPLDSTVYTATVVTENGCVIERRVAVNVNLVCALDMVDIPNVFTPDGDDVNDNFAPVLKLNSAEIISMEIYNRWGEKLYEGSGRNAKWNGTQNGQSVPSDVYVYILKMGCVENERVFTGDVTVLR